MRAMALELRTRFQEGRLMSYQQNFVSLALAGKVSADEIDDYVDKWHNSPSGLELHEYMGITRDEYAIWLGSPEELASILTMRKSKAL
jgi:hypothetical protein